MAFAFCLGTFLAHADDSPHVVQKFVGTSSTSTSTFTVGDKWEITWDSPMPVRITLLSSDGTIVAGASVVFKGSLYQPKGGTYYLQVENGNGAGAGAMTPWRISVIEMSSAPATPAVSTGGGMMNSNGTPYAVPSTVLPPAAQPATATSTPATNAPPVTPPPVLKLTEDQARAVVVVKGDNAEGTGFLVKMPDGPVVVTNLHVISNNPHVKLLTSTGAEITTTSLKGATDRDLVVFAIKDAGYSYLDLATDVSATVQTGDEVITPGNSQGSEVTVNTGGKIIGIGPQRVEFDNPIYHGNSGGPVFHVKSGKVVGIVTEVEKVDTSDEVDKASFNSHHSAINNSMRYFGLRLDTVPKWEIYDWRELLNETAFLDQFHEQSRRLDSYLNARPGTADARLYLSDDKIRSAEESFMQQASGGDTSQRLDALRGLLFELNHIADMNMAAVQEKNNFYSFNQKRAAEEADYRNHLKKELDSFGNDIDRFGSVARKND